MKRSTRFIALLLAFAVLVSSTMNEKVNAMQKETSSIEFFCEDVEVEKGTKNFDLLTGVSAKDSTTGEELEVTVKDKDNFDIKVPGRYKIIYEAETSGEKEETDRIVTVQEIEEPETGYEEPETVTEAEPETEESVVTEEETEEETVTEESGEYEEPETEEAVLTEEPEEATTKVETKVKKAMSRAAKKGDVGIKQIVDYHTDSDDKSYLDYTSPETGSKLQVSLHRTDDGKVAYCLNRTKKSDSDDYNYNYTETPGKDTKYTDMQRNILQAGYPANSASKLSSMYDCDVNARAAEQATQLAIWIANYSIQNDISLTAAYNAHAPKSTDGKEAAELCRAILVRANALLNQSVAIQAQKISEDFESIKLKVTITAKSQYFGIKGTLSGLPSGATIKGGSNVAVSGTSYSISGDHPNGTFTIDISFPTSSKNEGTLTAKVTGTKQLPPTFKGILFYDNSDSDYQSVVVVPGSITPTELDGEGTVSWRVDLPSAIRIVKTSNNGQIEGFHFNITGDDGSSYSGVTDSTGTLLVSNLMKYITVTYTVTEVGLDDSWIPQEPKTVTVAPGKTGSVSFSNVKKGRVRLTKISDDGDLQGKSFTITGPNNYNKTYKTDNQGKIDFGYLTAGTYTITENVEEKYVQPASQTVTLANGEDKTVSFHNILKGRIHLIKTSEDGELEGKNFTITGPNNYNKTYETDNQGKIDFGYLTAGTYTITENAEDKYVQPSSQVVTLANGDDKTVSFHNVLKKMTIKVHKGDKETGNVAQGDAVLQGAEYTVYDASGKAVDVITIGSDLTGTSKILVCGKYTVKETKAPVGYKLDDTVYTVNGDVKQQVVELKNYDVQSKEDVIKGRIRIQKVLENPDEDSDLAIPAKGITFTYKLNSNPDQMAKITLDEDGIGVSDWIPYGTYTLSEDSAPEGWKTVLPKTVSVTENQKTYKYFLTDPVDEMYIRIVKKDKETDKTIPQAGTTFKIKAKKTGEWVEQKVTYPSNIIINQYTTNEEGWLMMPEKLQAGSYELHEVQAPTGYVLNKEPLPFQVTGNGVEEDTITLEFYDMPQKAKVSITKTGEMFTGALEQETEYGTAFIPQYELRGLKGVEYTITAKEDIVTGDGTVRMKKDESIKATTDDKGVATWTLYLGNYEITEIKTMEGYILNSEPIEVNLTYAGQDVKVQDVSFERENVRQKAEISYEKSFETSKYELQEEIDKSQIIFGLYAREDMENVDGDIVIKKDALLGVAGIDNEKKGTFETDVPYGHYYIKEIRTDKHYAVSEKEYDLEFVYSKDMADKEFVEIQANEGKKIENKLILGSLVILKIEKKTGGEEQEIPLKGAEYQVYTADQKPLLGKGDKEVTGTTNWEGKVTFEDLPVGQYYYKEIKAPISYAIDDTYYSFEIQEENRVVKETRENEIIKQPVSFTKTDIATSEGLPNCEVEIRNKETGEVVVSGKTDKKGYLDFGVLEYGKYTFQEKKAPEGYVIDDTVYEFEITENGVEKKLNIQDKKITAPVTFTKTDMATSEGLPNCEVEIKNKEKGEVVVSGKTDKKGYLDFGVLEYGKYTFQEKKAPEGYVIDDTVYEFEITENGVEKKLNIQDKKITAPVTFTKTDMATSEGLPNCEVEIKNKETGEVVVSGKTDKKGYLDFGVLEYGKYTFQEKKAPVGYVIDDTVYEFEITENGVEKKLNIQDKKITAPVTFTKTDMATSEGLPNCEVEIKNKETGEVVVSGKTDKKGYLDFGVLEYGKYTFQEKKAPEGYVIDTTVYEFEITEDGVEKKLNIKDRKIKGTMILSKTDISTGEPVPNCKVEIRDSSGKIVVKGTTDEKGKITFKNLEYGDYTYKEYDAPKGYSVNEKEYKFSIKKDGEIVKCKMTNRKEKGKVTVSDSDSDNNGKTIKGGAGRPKTGDTTPILLFMMLCAISAAFIIFFIYRKRKRAKENECE